jgi:hypothetical protein
MDDGLDGEMEQSFGVGDFIKMEHADLEMFEEYWNRKMKEDPEHFPATMEHGEWWEQYTVWSQSME